MEKSVIPGITKEVSATTARKQFYQLLQQVEEKQARFLITKRGKAVAVLLSVEDPLWKFVEKEQLI